MGVSTVVALSPITLGVLLAAYELTLGTCMIIGGRPARWGLLAGIAFLVASTPLSTWTLPNLILAGALVAIMWREPEPAPLRGRHSIATLTPAA